MKITQEQYQLIADTFPKQRGNVKVSNRQALNGILYILEHGCKWRALPEEFGNWHTIYMRMSRWSHSGVLDRVFQRLQQEQLIDPEVLGSDSTSVKVHPDGTGTLKKRGSPGHRPLPGRVDHQDSYGRRQRSYRHQIRSFPRSRP